MSRPSCRLAVALALLLVFPSASRADEAPAAPPAPPAATAQPAAPRPPFDPDAPAETQFRNIKVFTGMKAGALRDTMAFMEASLGVGCSFCHARGGLHLDDKPAKDAARRMITMVQRLNKDMFEGKNVVTCFTCHQGHAKPVSVPAFERPTSPADAFVADAAAKDAPAPALPSADAVLARFATAVGGREALDALRGLKLAATQSDGEHAAQLEMTWRPPASLLTVMREGEGERAFVATQGTDGSAAWTRRGDEPAHDLRGMRRALALQGAELLPALALGAAGTTEVLGTGRIDGAAVIVLAHAGADGPTARLYFDAETGLLRRRAFEVATPLGDIPFRFDYSDWRPVLGVKLPHSVRVAQPGEAETMTLVEVADAGALDAGTFAKP